MLTSRNVILFALIVAFLSVLGTVVSLSLPPDSGGRGADSYGTHLNGQRGLFDLLRELKIPVDRGLAPPSATARGDCTLVLWAPSDQLVQYEPSHLAAVGEWIKNGGRAVIARESQMPNLFQQAMPSKPITPRVAMQIDLLKALGLDGVKLTKYDIEEKSAERTQRLQQLRTQPIWNIPPEIARPEGSLPMQADGSLATIFPKPLTVFTPYEEIQIVDIGTERVPVGRIFNKEKDGTERTFVAEYEFGKGRIIVVSEPALFENHFMLKDDNPILAAKLFHAQDRAVIIDEFYHGLTVRGNAFWLLTKHPFGLLFFASFVAAAFYTLRQAVHLGPPLGERPPNRRTLNEYVGAMSNLFHRAGHFKFVLREVRDGTLWYVRRKLGLAPQHEDLERIAAVLARKHPEDAKRLRAAVQEADEILSGKRPATGIMVLQAGRKLSECL